MLCELCGSDEAVELSTGLTICRPCFWTPGRLNGPWVNKRIGTARPLDAEQPPEGGRSL